MKRSGAEKSRFIPYWVLGLLAVVTVVLFANSWTNPFILDDLVKVVNNSDLRNWDRLGDTLVYPYGPTPNRNRNDPSRPLVYLIYTVIYHFFSNWTVPYHVVNTIIHLGNGVLVYLLIQIFSKNGYVSLLMALLFLLLPIQAGVVIYIYGLSDLLSTFFVLLGFYFFIRRHSVIPVSQVGTLVPSALQQGSKRASILDSILVGVCSILAFAAKQTGIVLPIVLGLYELSFASLRAIEDPRNKSKGRKVVAPDLAFLSEGWQQRLKIESVRVGLALLPVTVITLVYLGLRYFYLGGIGDLEGFQQVQKGFSYLSAQGMVILKYIQLTFIPLGLTIDHGILAEGYSGWVLFVCWLIVAGVVFLGFRLIGDSSSIKKTMGFGILFYLAVVLPTSILPTVDCLAERRVYLANFGLLIVLSGILLDRFWLKAGPWKVWAGAGLLLVYFTVSFTRNQVFASERLIWEESLSSYPGYSRALINAAWAYVLEKKYERGEEMLKLVLRYMPDNTEVLAKLGTMYEIGDYSKKDPETALSYFQRAIDVNSDYYIGRYLAAGVLARMNRLTEAKEMLRKAVETNRSFSPGYLLLGKIAEMEKNFELAQSYLKTAHQIDPEGNAF